MDLQWLAPHRNSWSCLTQEPCRVANDTSHAGNKHVSQAYNLEHHCFMDPKMSQSYVISLSSPDRIHIANLWGGAAQRLADAQGLHLLLFAMGSSGRNSRNIPDLSRLCYYVLFKTFKFSFVRVELVFFVEFQSEGPLEIGRSARKSRARLTLMLSFFSNLYTANSLHHYDHTSVTLNMPKCNSP